MDWKIYSLGALLLWGIWGFLGKIGSRDLSDRQFLTFAVLGFSCALPFLFLWTGRELVQVASGRAVAIAMLTGVISVGASLCYYMAISKGEVSRIVVVTSVYPVVTCILSYLLLGERLEWGQILGVVLCLAGVLLLVR